MSQVRFEHALRKGEKHLGRVDPLMRKIIKAHGRCSLKPEWRRGPYEALIRSVTFQQLHGKAAETIYGRFLDLFEGPGFPEPERVLTHNVESLRAVGLSRAKSLAILDIAARTKDGVIPQKRAGLTRLDDEVLIERFTQARGVGRWTVEMFLIFSLGRLDVLPVDDFGVRQGYTLAAGLREQIKPKVLAERGACWAPYRSLAAWYLWRVKDTP